MNQDTFNKALVEFRELDATINASIALGSVSTALDLTLFGGILLDTLYSEADEAQTLQLNALIDELVANGLANRQQVKD